MNREIRKIDWGIDCMFCQSLTLGLLDSRVAYALKEPYTLVYLTTPFLDKSPRDSLPVLSAHSFASNCKLAIRESAKEGNNFSTKECAAREDRSRDSCLQSRHATDRPTAHVTGKRE